MTLISGPGTQAARILLVGRDEANARTIGDSLTRMLSARPAIAVADNGRAAADRLRTEHFDVLLIELSNLADLSSEAEEAVRRLVRLSVGALVVVIADEASVSAAMAVMRAGAHDYVVRPDNDDAFASRIRELGERHGKAQVLGIVPRGQTLFNGMVGVSSQMQVIYEQIERAATSSAPVFITGESGTGKGLCAEALHRRGPRSERPFIAVNCAAVRPDRLEGELFGTARRGAELDIEGAAELANGGTLFLDEVGEMALSVQARLLRMLQTKSFSRVGETGTRQVDVRVICSTGRSPMQLMADRKFREDLFYRLHALPIHLPPLRQRPADIPVLAEHFLRRFAGEERKAFAGFSEAATALMLSRDWPGNIRQLQDLVHRAVVMFEGIEITPAMLEAAELEARPPVQLAKARPQVLPMWRQEQRIIEEAIESFGGNIALAAAALELSPSTIYRKRQAWAEMDGKRGAA